MSGIIKCAHCGSPDTQHGFDNVTCLACGKLTTVGGEQTFPAEQEETVMTEPDAPVEEPTEEPVPEETPEPADTPDE